MRCLRSGCKDTKFYPEKQQFRRKIIFLCVYHLIIIYPSKPHVMSCMLFRLIHRHSILQTLSWNLFADVADMMPWLMIAKAMVLPSAEVR